MPGDLVGRQARRDLRQRSGYRQGKLQITGTRGGKKLVPLTIALVATDGPCTSVATYGLVNTMAGFDPKTGLFAFSNDAEEKNTVCFSHAFVVTLK